MDRLLVETTELRPEYQERNRLWEKYYKRFFLFYAHMRWKPLAIVHYGVVIDIELGTVKYYYFKYGITYALKRIVNYNQVLAHRLEGRNVELDPKDFYIETLLTDSEQINNQLDKELLQYV